MKMKKQFRIILSLIFLITMVLGCTSNKNAQNQQNNTPTPSQNAMAMGLKPYNYKIIDDAMGKKDSDVEQWLLNYYPNNTVSKEKYSNSNETWYIKFTSPPNPISIDGYIYYFDDMTIDFRYEETNEIQFSLRGQDVNEFNSIYTDLEAKYGSQNIYVGKKDFLMSIIDPDYEFNMYSWSEKDFDNVYYLVLTRSGANNDSTIGLSFEQY